VSSDTGMWMALLAKRKVPTIDEIATLLATMKQITIHKVDDRTLVVTTHDSTADKDVDITLGVTDAPHVVRESAELAKQFAADRVDRERIASLDARVEMLWDLADSNETYNAMFTIAMQLEHAYEAVIFDLINQRWV
jgi:hypothetical protein